MVDTFDHIVQSGPKQAGLGVLAQLHQPGRVAGKVAPELMVCFKGVWLGFPKQLGNQALAETQPA